jgi:hypothetical protein
MEDQWSQSEDDGWTTPRANRRRNGRVVGRVVRDSTDGEAAVKIEYEYFDKATGTSLASSSAVLALEDGSCQVSHVTSNLPVEQQEEKKHYTLSFANNTIEDEDDHTCKIRKHMRDIIKTHAVTLADHTYFLGHENFSSQPQLLTPTELLLAQQQEALTISMPKSPSMSENINALSPLGMTDSIATKEILADTQVSLLFRKQPEASSPRRSNTIAIPQTLPSQILTQTGIQQKVSLFQRIFSPRQSVQDKTDSELRYELRKYERRLLTSLKESKNMIKQLHTKEISLVQSLYPEMLYLRKCALVRIIPTFRALCIIKMQRLQVRRELEKGCKTLIKNRLEQIKQALNTGPKDKLPPFVTLEFFKDIDSLLLEDSKLCDTLKYVKRLERRDRILTDRYQTLRKQYGANLKRRGKKEQLIMLKDILSRTHIHKCTYNCGIYKKACQKEQGEEITWREFLDCIYDTKMQNVHVDFYSMVSDERSTEGQSIRTFLGEVDNLGWDRVPPKEIIDYVTSYVTFLCSANMYRITDEVEIEKIAYLVHQYFFGSLVGNRLSRVEEIAHAEDNRRFATQVRLLKDLTPQQLGVSSKFLSPDDDGKRSFAEPIEILSLLGFCATPNDMLHCVYTCAKLIHIIARDNCSKRNKELSFGADEFIPIMIYVVAHAFLPLIHSNLAFMSKYANCNGPNYNNSEVMYFLTCLEGAVVYVDNLTQEELDNLLAEPQKRCESTRVERPNLSVLAAHSDTVPSSVESEDKLTEISKPEDRRNDGSSLGETKTISEAITNDWVIV